MTINDTCFTRAVQEMEIISFSGTCAISCDETSIFQKLSLGFDKDLNATVLVGALQGPVVVPDHDVEQVQHMIESGSYELASKVSLIYLKRVY
jgi:hypothetical protein